MPIFDHTDSFAGRQLIWYDPERGPLIGPPGRVRRLGKVRRSRSAIVKGETLDPMDVAYRIDAYYDVRDTEGPDFADIFEAFLSDERIGLVEALVIGPWEYNQMIGQRDPNGSEGIVEELVAARERLAGLKALFLGDMICQECELDWLNQADVTPLFEAYPDLELFRVRGRDNLRLAGLRHRNLTQLTIESAGLTHQLLKEVWESELPELENLELWLGGTEHGEIDSARTLEPLLSGELFPRLRRLALRNSAIADEAAAALVSSPLLDRLEELDLSLGTFGDEGARALIASPATRTLARLDVHHHFMSREVQGELHALGMDVRSEQRQELDEYGGGLHRFVVAWE